MSDIYFGETYDARLERPGWSEAGHAEDDWSAVRTVGHSKDILSASTAPPVRHIQALQPVAVIRTPEGDTVLDMGQNMVGRMRMTVRGPAGTEVVLRHAETLDWKQTVDGQLALYRDVLEARRSNRPLI